MNWYAWSGLLLAIAAMAHAGDERYPTLAELQDWQASGAKDKPAGGGAIRAQALRESALRVGAQGAYGVETCRYNARLRALEAELTRIYRFDQILTDQARVLPPVVIEARNSAVFEAGKATLTRQVYKIVEPARIVSAPPAWQDYLLTPDPAPPQKPPSILLPRSVAERETWRKDVAAGWEQGKIQSERALSLRIAKLHRAFVGRVRYRLLVLRGLAVPAMVASSGRSVKASDTELRIGEEIIRITQPAKLVARSRQWQLLPQLPNAFTLEFGDDF